MSAATKIAFAKEWFTRGECPGCGAPLAKVAGQKDGHVKPFGHYGRHHTKAGPDGQPVALTRPSEQHCSWTADDLTSLVLLATDFGRSADEVTVPAPSPVASSAERAGGQP